MSTISSPRRESKNSPNRAERSLISPRTDHSIKSMTDTNRDRDFDAVGSQVKPLNIFEEEKQVDTKSNKLSDLDEQQGEGRQMIQKNPNSNSDREVVIQEASDIMMPVNQKVRSDVSKIAPMSEGADK